MNDRERIAAIIAETHTAELCCDCKECVENALTAADAVLAALDGRLLPELPKGDTVTFVALGDDDLYTADVWRGGDVPKLHCGSGPTIPAAIAAALEDDHE